MSIFQVSRISVLALLLTSCASGPPDNAERGERGGKRGPPAEAIEACKDKVEGDACSFSGQRGDEEGSCAAAPRNEAPRNEDVLACMPSGQQARGVRRNASQVN